MKPIVPRWKNIFAVATLVAIVGCSKQPATPPHTTPSEPLVTVDHVPSPGSIASPTQPADEYRGFFAPGGIAANYRATFSEGQVRTIEEKRTADGRTADYKFEGARLLKYQGAALGSADTLELEFDLQGKVLVARAGDKDASPEEISAIRDRAQSLRSHAVARYAMRKHEQK